MAGGPNDSVSRGFLWGCVTPLAVLVLLVAAWFTYNTYYFTSGYKKAPGLPNAMAVVRTSPVAAKMLGDNIQIERMELSMNGEIRKGGRRIFYKVLVRGTKAEGQIQTSVLIAGKTTKITDLKLIANDGNLYNLLQKVPAP